MASYGAGKYGRAGGSNAIVVQGFEDLQRALRATEIGVQKEVQSRIKVIGAHVAEAAKGNVPHATGRHSSEPSIEAGMRVSAVLRGASIYTTAVHGGVQNVGAWSKARGPHIRRQDASHYMDRAVTSSKPFVEAETQAVLDWITTTFEEA
jgi:hypothetical protein